MKPAFITARIQSAVIDKNKQVLTPLSYEVGEKQVISDTAKVNGLVQELMSLSGAYIELPGGDSLQPVVVSQRLENKLLAVDVSAIRRQVIALGDAFEVFLVKYRNGVEIKSSPLRVENRESRDGRLFIYCSLPEFFETCQRRSAFRAAVHPRLECFLSVRFPGSDTVVKGSLRDLSIGGALMDLSLTAWDDYSGLVDVNQGLLNLTLSFPSQIEFHIAGEVRHTHVELEKGLISIGFEFAEVSPNQDRELASFVREIERQTTILNRGGDEGPRQAVESRLFTRPKMGVSPQTSSDPCYATPMARRLSSVAKYLDGQILALKLGDSIDSAQLSKNADKLLLLLEQDRNGLLFALQCLQHHHPLTRHGLSVAAKLTAALEGRGMTRPELKAVAACGMIHELGKCLLPADQAGNGAMEIKLIAKQLKSCNWIDASIKATVVGNIHERLDGSGYPQGLAGDQINALSRLAAVISEIDILCRGDGQTPPLPVTQAFNQVMSRTAEFDPICVKAYIQCFGVMPVGSLLRFSDGTLGWVLENDASGMPLQLQLTRRPSFPTQNSLGEILTRKDIVALGKPLEILVPSS